MIIAERPFRRIAKILIACGSALAQTSGFSVLPFDTTTGQMVVPLPEEY
jgi:hypothetical protein